VNAPDRKMGTGPPFTLTMVLQCPGIRDNQYCGGSARVIQVFEAGLRSDATDEDRRRADSMRRFCLGSNCPFFRGQRLIRVQRLESILATAGASLRDEDSSTEAG
jgi:hypothetical protein